MATKVLLDMVRKDRGLVVFSGKNRGGGIIKDGSRWLAEEGDSGRTVGESARTAKAAVAVLAKHYGITEDLDVEVDEEWKDGLG
jgi:hypothetical protein